jgi:pyridoxal phosphate enzyme (YggS family)
VKTRLLAIRERIERACESVGRDPSEVTLIAVSKGFPADAVREAFDLGCRDFGENRFQEALGKFEALPQDLVAACTWHFIGTLQSRKVRLVVDAFDVVHTLDRESQLAQLAKVRQSVTALVEVNIAREQQKGGVLPEDLPTFVQCFEALTHVRLAGLMTMGPAEADAEAMRPFFAFLRQLGKQCRVGPWLSMGMSDDFDVAIQEGATHVRVGTALFGSR